MDVIATRGTVHPADEPEPLRFSTADDASPVQLLRRAADRRWLASIASGRATWSIVSNQVLAIYAQEWSDLKFMPMLDLRMRTTDRRDGILYLHFNYHAQIDPELVYRVLLGTALRA